MGLWKRVFGVKQSPPSAASLPPVAQRGQSTSIQEAAKSGDLETVKKLLAGNADLVFSKDTNGNTPLQLAAHGNHIEVVRLLLLSKADVNAENNDGWSPLLLAAHKGHKDIVELLVESKAEVNTKNKDGFTPLHVAASQNYTAVAELLLAWKAEVNAEDKNGWTPLHLAATRNNKAMVELLLTNKAEVNAKDKNGWTPMQFATEQGHMDVADLLRWHGGNADATREPSPTESANSISKPHASLPMPDALYNALQKRDVEEIKALLNGNPNLVFSREKTWGNTPLHEVAGFGPTEVVELLLANKAEVNATDRSGMTPLHTAAGAGNRDIVELLLAYNADVTADPTHKGMTPLLVAERFGHEDVAVLLRQHSGKRRPQPPPAVSPTRPAQPADKPLMISASEFAKCAAKGPAWSRLSIASIPLVITKLNEEMERIGVPSDAFHDLYNNSLLGVCPKCNEYCAGKAFLRMPLLAAAGGRVSFTGNSGGFERMLEGTCLNYSCPSTEFDLFWSPDLDVRMLQNLTGRGINLDPNIQRLRNNVWKPQ